MAERLAIRTGFKDGATAKAHYEPLLNPDHRPSNAPKNRQIPRDASGEDQDLNPIRT
ncbi:hypothetical protein F5Y16DRAFT_406166 [Xylariaceae sp. FL0255]|nr:hypothetical protein F5Y16DRAFT_406166 [Xylariaceae sp. FL0255]